MRNNSHIYNILLSCHHSVKDMITILLYKEHKKLFRAKDSDDLSLKGGTGIKFKPLNTFILSKKNKYKSYVSFEDNPKTKKILETETLTNDILFPIAKRLVDASDYSIVFNHPYKSHSVHNICDGDIYLNGEFLEGRRDSSREVSEETLVYNVLQRLSYDKLTLYYTLKKSIGDELFEHFEKTNNVKLEIESESHRENLFTVKDINTGELVIPDVYAKSIDSYFRWYYEISNDRKYKITIIN